MKNTTKKKVISALSKGLNLTLILGLGTGTAFVAASCVEEPEAPKPEQQSGVITLAPGKTVTAIFVALPNTTPAWWSKLDSQLQLLKEGFPAGNRTLTVTPNGTGGFVAGTPGSKMVTVGESWLNNATDLEVLDSLLDITVQWYSLEKTQNRIRYAGGMSSFELAQVKKHNDII